MPPWSLYRAFLGSDGKVLSAWTPVRIGLDACDAAAVGLRGAHDILEHPQGFLTRFATFPLPATITRGLGRRWHTETLSFKVRPGGPGIDAAVDCTLALQREIGPLSVDDVADVAVYASNYTVAVDRHITPYMDGDRSPVSALTFSLAYTVATALLTGRLDVSDFAPPRLSERERWALADKVRVVHDPLLTRRMRLSAVPLGEALREAGLDAAGDWLASVDGHEANGMLDALAAPSETFAEAEKVTPARVVIRLTDGRTFEHARDIPLGGAGPDTRARHWELVSAKFLATGGRPEVLSEVAALDEASPGEVTQMLAAALGD